ncbi:MAG: hypothetical protein U5K69_24215 [Balneolaceae bacterium]|nr:hypothetical protein [Balneolaceae bacterium]
MAADPKNGYTFSADRPTREPDLMAAKNLLLTNITGHPSVILPNGFDESGNPTSITFIGDLFDEGTLLEVAGRYQKATTFHTKHPELFTKGSSNRHNFRPVRKHSFGICVSSFEYKTGTRHFRH